MNNTIAGVDLAKNVIQVCVCKGKKVLSNTEMTPVEFAVWLGTTKPLMIVFEACGMSNYWKQQALAFGHNAQLISAKLVKSIRQTQKTDKNDALAIVHAAQLPDVSFIAGKSTEQQELQTVSRLQELATKHKAAQETQIKALLLEFNIRPSSKSGGLGGIVQSVLEDAENGFSSIFREALNAAWQQLIHSIETVDKLTKCLEKIARYHPECKRLMALEGVGIINTINLYIALGCDPVGAFKAGRDASACIGVTPIQYSSGGKVKMGSIGKHVKNGKLRSQLVCGAMAAIQQICKRDAKTTKELWIQNLVARRGKRCAAVALANKTVRTAFALLSKGTTYKAEPLVA